MMLLMSQYITSILKFDIQITEANSYDNEYLDYLPQVKAEYTTANVFTGFSEHLNLYLSVLQAIH